MLKPLTHRRAARLLFLVIAALALATAQCVAADPAGAPIDFGRDIRPILSDKCYKCHGPDAHTREANLRLDRRKDAERVLAAAEGGTSELIRRVTHADPDERMPPASSNLSLTKPEIELLERWIAAGAPYEEHWAFIPPRDVTAPEVKARDWPRNEIDRFVLARLEAEGLSPRPEAPKETLIRRVTFDLTGLPPTIAEVDAFLADDSPEAYEHLVDDLLSRTSYGERMTADWLDVARYSDSYGYQVDRDRFVWPWRDWVIDAFNRNLPFDEFITWQIAGDLLPDATDEQILATTFNRLHPQKVEGGSVPEEFRVEYVADRTNTVATAFLGLTFECARCHDHKYDPISQKEYYELFAFFNQIDEAGLYSFFTSSVPTPTLLLADDAAKARIADVEARIAASERALEATIPTRREAFAEWLRARPSELEVPGRVAHLDFESFDAGANKIVEGKHGNAIELTGDDGVGLNVGNFRRFEPFSVALWMWTPDVKERAVVYHRSRAWTDAASRGYELLIEDGKLSAALIHFDPGNAIRVRAREPIPTRTWIHVAVTWDGSSRADGLRIWVDGAEVEREIVRDKLTKNITGGGGDTITIGERFRDRGFTRGRVDDFQVFDRELTAIEVATLHDGTRLHELASKPVEELTAVERDALFEYWLSTQDGAFRDSLAALRAVREERSRTVDPLPEIMVMRELEKARETFVLHRGAYDAPRESVLPDTPEALSPFPEDAPRNRLGLARWLTDPRHPLVARVTVNRLWQMCFGQGIVRTPEDFGSQGAPPSHPELLDWLAKDFTRDWDLKRFLRQIVTSSTYRQSSVAPPELRARDPENRLLARGPSHRLPAEMIRDNALFVSGLLTKTIGGAPATPYEVEVSFKPVPRGKGDDLYRRSFYTYWKRTGPAPVMTALDAAKRDVCTVKRERTASPLQALILLNDPQFVEAARSFGEALVRAHGDDADRIIEHAFRALTSRRPSVEERTILRTLHDEELRYFEEDPTRADAFLSIGDSPRDASLPAAKVAAAGAVALTLLNFDECVMKR